MVSEIGVLFVCTGNICRSPTAEGVARKLLTEAGLAARVAVDSAGLEGWHAGDPPDPRAIACAAARGYDLAPQRARRFDRADFGRFALILGMDRGHVSALCALRDKNSASQGRGACVNESSAKLILLSKDIFFVSFISSMILSGLKYRIYFPLS